MLDTMFVAEHAYYHQNGVVYCISTKECSTKFDIG